MSEFNRRDLLKYFGIGATIVPLVGGTPELRAPARLIETPNLEPVHGPVAAPFDILAGHPPGLLPPLSLIEAGQKVLVTMDFVATERFGSRTFGPLPIHAGLRYRFQAESMIVGNSTDNPDVTLAEYYNQHFSPFAPGVRQTKWTISGVAIGPVSLATATDR